MALPVNFEAEVFTTSTGTYKDKEGTDREYYSVTVIDSVSGTVAKLSCDSADTLNDCEVLKREVCEFSAEYNPDYKTLRVVGVRPLA